MPVEEYFPSEKERKKRTEEDQIAWDEYRMSGGQYSFDDWVKRGRPTAEFEQAALSYMARVNEWVNYMVDTAGWSESEAATVFNNEYDELFGGGKTVGKTTNWAKVNTYSENLTEGKLRRKTQTVVNGITDYLKDTNDFEGTRTRIRANADAGLLSEEDARELLTSVDNYEQNVRTDIARQQQVLPLGRGGTGVEQVWAASHAITNLQSQMEAAPNYLKPIIQGQIDTLNDFMVSQKEVERIKASGQEPDEAMALALQLYGRRKEKGYSFTAWLRDTAEGQAANQYVGQQTGGEVAISLGSEEPGAFAQQFAEKYDMSAGAAQQTGLRYAQHPESEEFANLTTEERDALSWVGREAGGGEIQEAKKVLPPYGPPEFKGISTTGGIMWREEFERRYPSVLGEFAAKPKEERTETGWLDLLEKRRTELKEKWLKQSPYQRGVRPEVFAPKIKTVGF